MSPHCQQHHDEGQVCDEQMNGLASLQLSDSDLHEWEKQKSDAHVDLAAYDHATLALAAALAGHNGDTQPSELPVLPVAPWNRRPGYLGHLTPEQEHKLEAMRQSFPEAVAWHTDHDLLRFLRARGFNLDAACPDSKFCRLEQYRGRMLVSPAPIVRHTSGGWPLHLVDLFPARPEEVTMAMLAAMRCFLHILQHSTDRQGRPVIYVRIADIIKARMADYVPLPTRLAMHSANCELNKLLCVMASARAGYHIEELTQVLDMGGLTPLQLIKQICSGVGTPQIKLLNEYFPETLGQVIFINAPSGAGKVWHVAQMFVPHETRQKVTICGSSYKEELLKHIEAHNLPDCYGGALPFSWPPHQPPEDFYE